MAAVTATATFVCFVDGVRTRVTEGAVYDSADVVVKEHKDLFSTPEAATRTKPAAASRPEKS
jgi:hypothetical protein